MSALYFAYGSNLKLTRLRERVPGAGVVGVARLAGFRIALDKRGRDGSGKANISRAPGSVVWGVVYRFEAVGWGHLDPFERGYERIDVRVDVAEDTLRAETYEARVLTVDSVAYDWYKRLVVEGAREHGLPADYVKTLERLPERPDPR